MTNGKFYKITKGLKGKREKGQTYLGLKEKKGQRDKQKPYNLQTNLLGEGMDGHVN